MTLDSVPELARRILHLEMELKRVKPSAGTDNAALLKRMSALEGVVARLSKATPTKPQVYTPKPAVRVPKPTDNSLALKLAALEREVERLRVWERPAGGSDTVGDDVSALLMALETHKTSSDHDGRYYTETETNALLLLKADKTLTLTAGDGLNWGGNLSENRTFNVVAGDGILVTDDAVNVLAGLGIDFDVNGAVIVDQTENFNWTGEHTFTKYLSTASIYPNVSDTYDLGDYNRLWRKIWGSELSAIVFAQYTQVLLGGWFTVSKGEGIVKAAVTAAATRIDLGSNNFATNDIIVFRGIGAGNNPQIEYMKVGTLVSGTTYNVTRNLDGTGANAWADGSVYGNWGQTGNGRVELNAYDTPRMSVYSQGAAYNDATEEIRIGDLYGQWGYNTNTYGAAFGSYKSGKANITIDPTNGIRIRNYNQDVIKLTGTAASFENFITLGTNGGIRQGTGTWGSSFTGTAMWNDSGVMNIGGWNNNVKQWWGGSDGKLYAGGGDVILDQEGIKLYNDDTYSGAGRIDFYDAYDNPIGALYGWGETATPLTLHEIMLNVSDDRPVGTDTTTSIIMLSESYNNARIKLQAAVPAIYKDNVNATILLSKDDTGNNIRMYGDVTLGDHTVNSDLVVNGTIKDGDDIAYLKSTDLGVWNNWTPTQTGWTALPTGTYRYCQIGKMCFFAIDITAGTSNSNLATLSLPATAKSGTYWSGVNGMAMNNGTVLSVASKWYIDASNSLITFGTDMGTGLWTSSGTKRVRTEGFYEIA